MWPIVLLFTGLGLFIVSKKEISLEDRARALIKNMQALIKQFGSQWGRFILFENDNQGNVRHVKSFNDANSLMKFMDSNSPSAGFNFMAMDKTKMGG